MFYVLCSDEELWMNHCLAKRRGDFVYKGSWKWTTLAGRDTPMDKLPPPIYIQGIESLFLYAQWCRRNMTLSDYVPAIQSVPRYRLIDPEDGYPDVASSTAVPALTPEQWRRGFDEPVLPLILTNVCEGWPAFTEWSLERLAERYPNVQFRVSTNAPFSVRMTLKDYCAYLASQRDEVPLYVFDSHVGGNCPEMLHEYKVNACRRCSLITTIWHFSGTNDLIFAGVEAIFDDHGNIVDFNAPPSLLWYLEVYPFLDPEEKPIECVQHPGETISVPAGWWHMVLNLDYTCAVTQNYLNVNNLEDALGDLRPHRRYKEFLQSLLVKQPELADTKLFCERALLQEGVASKAEFMHRLTNLKESPWRNRVGRVLVRHGLLLPEGEPHLSTPTSPTRPSLDSPNTNLALPADFAIKNVQHGENPVFQCDQNCYVKFYSFRSRESDPYTHEVAALERIALDPKLSKIFPRLLGHGMLHSEQEVAQTAPTDPTHAFDAWIPAVHVSNEQSKRRTQFNNAPDSVPIRAVNGHHFKHNDAVVSVPDSSDGATAPSETTPAAMATPNNGDQHVTAPIVWRWPYTILEAKAGIPMEDVEDDSAINYDALVEFLSSNLTRLHKLGLGDDLSAGAPHVLSESWAPALAELEARLAKCYHLHCFWSMLPFQLLQQLPAYLPASMTELVDQSVPPALLHGDVHVANILMVERRGAGGGGGRTLSAKSKHASNERKAAGATRPRNSVSHFISAAEMRRRSRLQKERGTQPSGAGGLSFAAQRRRNVAVTTTVTIVGKGGADLKYSDASEDDEADDVGIAHGLDDVDNNGEDDDDDDDDNYEDVDDAPVEVKIGVGNAQALAEALEAARVSYVPAHIIDLGDSRVGDPMADLIPIYLSVFRCDKKLLRRFLALYNPALLALLSSDAPAGTAARKKAMCYLLLHPVNAMHAVFMCLPASFAVATWEAMAELLWRL
ncbi:phosphatidylserine receptor long form [Capsaspora owczarzaki ATCC 30864]|uniref:phosphatidylserine receptor long form n=1 Tax=Capsaspora owczarzaki (strain ATCC 30864) TaxID=595528 RepID=UPI0001FE6957|nr:phosphatidylserine receptor long form [Capsaspora owczarzaki ATCC 30864]|eukprot:XP_004363982.1 phosphatidylserine receptor long form [Capsaspora owczarzaki ATCC 30864]